MFSHGLGGTRTTYSVLCSHLAAQGRVVIAMEHRDGTGPAVFPGGRTMQYLVPDEAVWQGEKVTPDWQRGAYNSEKALRLRSDQLAFRRAEVYEALRCLKDLSSQGKEASNLEAFGAKDFDYAKWLHHISSDEVDLVGHSFGGATVVSENLKSYDMN
jgi:platelet-activating factor acetylhydrolase